MKSTLLEKNQSLRMSVSLPLLACFAMFTAWQMGIMFYTGTALSVDGKTPLPITGDHLTLVIAAAYILSIIFLIFFQKHCVAASRITLIAALLSALALFQPLSPEALTLAIEAQAFCCVFFIGVSMAVVINLFTERTELCDVLVTTVLSGTIIAILQNDLVPVPFGIFRGITVAMLALLIFFFFRLPTGVWPEFVKKSDGLPRPKQLMTGVFLLVGLSCFMTLFGSAVAGATRHGVSVYYLSTAVCGAVVFILWKYKGVSPLRCAKVLVALAIVGFVLAMAGGKNAAVSLIGCVFLGCGCLVCLLASFFGVVLAKQYPSRFITPMIIALGLITVLIDSALLEVFRSELDTLYMLYTLVAVLTALSYLLLEPTLLWSVRSDELGAPAAKQEPPESPEELTLSRLDGILSKTSADPLTGQELRVAHLILQGYTNTEMSALLSITENTVKGYRKNLYSKLLIHSRRELFELANAGASSPE